MKKYTFNPKYVPSKNYRNLEAMMDSLTMGADEGMFCCVYGSAGRGKSKIVKEYCSNNTPTTYIQMMKTWRKSDIPFLMKLASELDMPNPPRRRDLCFDEILRRLKENPHPVFLDEIEKMPPYLIEICRDITDVTTAPFILVGEEELVGYMHNIRRVWSRTFHTLEFHPVEIADVMMFIKLKTELVVPPEGAAMLLAHADGDLRPVRQAAIHLVNIVNTRGSNEVTMNVIEAVLKRLRQEKKHK